VTNHFPFLLQESRQVLRCKFFEKEAELLFCFYRFDSSVSPFIFADQFIKLSTRLSSPLVYGLGEHRQSFVMNVTNEWKKLTFWSRDFPPVPDINLYGSLNLSHSY
jgi:hypothetical protein